jgi:predicted RNase H-like HicB family nuclease
VRFTAAVSHEAPWFVARCLDVEVTSQGENVDEALENLREALELYLEDQPFPDDIKTPIIATVDVSA